MKRIIFAISIAIIGITIGFTIAYHSHYDQITNNSYYSAIKLHSDEGHYITFAIKKRTRPEPSWDFVIPEWYSKYFGVQLFWCKNSNDFFVISGDTGLHLYVYDSLEKTWKGDYYIKEYMEKGSPVLFYWDKGIPIAPYPIGNIPDEVCEYLYEMN